MSLGTVLHESKRESVCSYSPDELRLIAIRAVSNKERLDKVIGSLAHLESSMIAFIRHHFEMELLKMVKAYLKERMIELILQGKTAFINEGKTGLTVKSQFFQDINKQMSENGVQAPEEWNTELQRFFHVLMSRFIPSGPEETLKSLIFQWFESGEMSLETWRQWSKWFNEGVKLSTLKAIQWPAASPGDVVQLNFLNALKMIPTDDFQEKDGLIAVLKLYLQEPEIKRDKDGITLNIVGRTIFLSSIKKKIEDILEREKNILQVDIFAPDVFHIDADLKGKDWSGKNLCVVTDKVNVWGERIIDVSGSGYQERKWKAPNGGIGCDGTNGADGRPGESSGNIAIMTKTISNPQNLQLLLNGGNGENGQNGGDGGNGQDGKGVNLDELKAACVKYDSLYRTSWKHFIEYEPKNWTRTSCHYDYSKEYLYYEYTDADKRTMVYSLASYAGWTYSWYELFVWIKGTDGTAGGVGGTNGCGGEGGNRGECNVINPDTGMEFNSVNVIKNPGRNGADGIVGESGKSGSNGNHLAVIDRSASGTNKFFYGDKSATRLKMVYYVKSDDKRRMNGYRKHVANESSVFGEFEFQDVPKGGLTQTKQKKKQQRSTEAQTTMKKSIVLNKLWQKAAEHTAQLDGALAAALVTVKSTTAVNLEMEESVEDEESTEQEQEVVVVKEVNEDSLEIRRTRTKKSSMMPVEFSNKLLAKKTHESTCDLAQEVITFFLIEFTHTELNRLSIPMLLRCSRMREMIKNPFKKTLVGAVQNKKDGGLTVTELDHLSKHASQQRRLKRLITKHRHDVSNYAEHCQSAKLNVDCQLTPQGDKLFQVKFAEPIPTALWNVNINPKEIIAFTKLFFNDYSINEVEHELLLEIQKIQEYLKAVMGKHLTSFGQHQVDWSDTNAWESFKANWTKESVEIRAMMKDISPLKDQLIVHFREYTKMIADQSLREKLQNKVQSGGNSELESRFGKVPDFHHRAEENLEASHFLIRFFHQMGRLIEFNRTLMIVSLIHHAETTKEALQAKQVIKSYPSLGLDNLIARIRNASINLESNAVEEYMRSKGFRSAAFRYLVAELTKTKIEIYGNEDYGDVQLIELWNPNAKNLLRLAFDGDHYHDLIADVQLRQLLTARSNHPWTKHFQDYRQRLSNRAWNYTSASSKNDLATYFPSGFAASVLEWIDCYVASTGDQNFLKMLHERFEVDGNHLKIADFQFLISTAIRMQCDYRVSSEFLLDLASSVPQSKLVDTFFMARIESQWRRQFEYSFGIVELLHQISVSRLKILLATKLIGQRIEEKTLKNLLVMLSFTSTNNKQLEKMNLVDWITMAEKQKYFTVSNEMKEFASVGYYIIYLKQRDRREASLLEKILTGEGREFHIPEQIIAQVCSLIIHNEIVFDERYIAALIELLELTTAHSGLKRTGKHQFICDELQQRNIIKKIKETNAYKIVITEKPRTLKTIAELVTGVHDNEEDREQRLTNSKKMATLLQNPSSNASVKHLMEIDAQITKIFKKNLRETQKMAIIYAVESEKNFLSQVNTGEGKSFIVASIAIIRARQFKSVDIITSSAVLAQRDAEEMQPLYVAMGLNVAHNCMEGLEDRKQAYKANVVYGEIGRFQRDHLLHDFYRKNILGDRERQSSCVIVDEVDNMLLDNGNNMLYLSHSVPGLELLESLFVHIQRIICSPTAHREKEEAFSTDTIEIQVLSDLLGRISKEDLQLLAVTSIAKKNCPQVWEKLLKLKMIDADGYLTIQTDEHFLVEKTNLLTALKSVTTDLHANKILCAIRTVVNRQREIPIPGYLIPYCRRHLREYIENAKRALFMNHNEAYVVDVDHTGEDTDITPKVTIIDQNTGVDLATSQWSEGLHQCIQIKHGCRLSPISLKAVFVSNVFYLKEYGRINGLSGTLGSIEESKTLVELYKTDLIQLPTFRAKKLYEHVPVITQRVEDWIDSIYAEIVEQVAVQRSVLVICRSIADVMQMKSGLIERSSKDRNASSIVKSCYETMVVYQRDFDQFNFGDNNALKPGKLILATNLAGRGTDIKLSAELRLAGGLHVIVSFLPENSRIEDQAYGRAARSGDPGSGQIIAITDKVDATGKPPSVFELKVFRDNAEVQRLQSMTDYYNFHTKIEESCLAAFKQHCLKALRQTSAKKSETGVPTKEEIIYFALLDEWALWLDSQTTAIKECARERSAAKRGEIITSVEVFLATHPIEPVEAALKWVNAPQPLLALGLIYIDQGNYPLATQIFESIINKYPEFAGEAFYYRGLIEQQSVRKVMEIPQEVKQSIDSYTPQFVIDALKGNIADTTSNAYENAKKALKDWLPDSVCEIDEVQRLKTEDYLLQAIRTFNQRSENKETLHTIVSRLRKVVGPRSIASSGFENQTKDVRTTMDCLSSSAYDMIGHSVSWQIFANMEGTLEDKYSSEKLMKHFMEEGYVSPRTLNQHLLPSQCAALKSNYFLSKRKIQRFFQEQMSSSSRVEFYNRTVFLPEELKKSFKLPRREEFWGFMVVHQCFSTLNEFFILDQTPSDGIIKELRGLSPISAPKSHRFRVQLSDFNLSEKILYDAKQVIKAFEEDNHKLVWLQSIGVLTFDASGIVDLDRLNTMTYLPNYDYFTGSELTEYLEIDDEEGLWIANALVNEGILQRTVMNFVQINPEKSVTKDVQGEKKKLYDAFLDCEQLRKIDNIDREIVKTFLELTDEDAQKTFEELKENKVLIDVSESFYFQAMDELDCSILPPCIRQTVSAFLYHKFAYTFAYNALRSSLEASMDNPSVKKSILLPWKPYQSLTKDLLQYGFVHDHKLELRERQFIDEDLLEKIKSVEEKIKPRLFIKSSELLSTKKYFKDEKLQTGGDVQSQAMHSFRQVGKIGENYAWLFWLALKILFTIFMAWSVVGLILLALDLVINFKSYWATALLVVAAVGTMLYFIQTIKAKYITQTDTQDVQERYTQIVDYHGRTVEMGNQRIANNKLANAIVTSINAKIDRNISLKVSDKDKANLQATLEDPRINGRNITHLIVDSLNQSHNWKLFRDALREFITLQKSILCAKYYTVLDSNRNKRGFQVEKALAAVQNLSTAWTLTSSQAMNKLLNSLLSKFVEDSIVSIRESLNSKVKQSSAKATNTPSPAAAQTSDAEEKAEKVDKTPTELYIDYLYDRASKYVNEEIVTQAGNPLLETFVRYIEHAIESTEAPEGLNHYLSELTDDKYSLEERGKEVIALQTRFFVSNDLHQAVRKSYQKKPNEQLKELIILYNHPR